MKPSFQWPSQVWFGLHYDLHASSRDTELGREVTHETLRNAWSRIRPDVVQCDCKGHPGWTSWPTRVGSPSPGIVRDALKIHREATRELGIPLVMHYSGVWDSRAVELHPEWAQIGPEGQPHKDYTCPLGGYVEGLMIPQLLELIDLYDVDGFWVDGDCWAALPCYCDRCTTRFVKETSFIRAPKKPEDPGWPQWLAFGRKLFFERTRRCAEAVHARNPECKYCGNWAFSFRMPDSVNVPVDFLSGDFTWNWAVENVAAETRFIENHGLPWNLMGWSFTTAREAMQGCRATKSLPALCQEAAAVLSHGGGFLLYEHPARSGALVEWTHARFAAVAKFCRDRQPCCQNTRSVPQVALLHSAGHYYAGNSPLFNFGDAVLPLRGALLALLENGHSVDILNEQMLLQRGAEYPVVMVVEQSSPSEALQAALLRFVRGGGCLALAGSGVAADFSKLAGVVCEGEPREEYAFLPVGDEAVNAGKNWQPVSCRDAEMVLPLLSGPDPKRQRLSFPAATLRSAGRGRVLAIHGPLFSHYQKTHYPRLREIIGTLVERFKERLMVHLQAPPRVEMALRQKDDRLFVNLLNRGSDHPLSAENVMVENVPPINGISLTVKLVRAPQSVLLQPGDRPLAWEWKEGILKVGPFELGIHDVVEIEGYSATPSPVAIP